MTNALYIIAVAVFTGLAGWQTSRGHYGWAVVDALYVLIQCSHRITRAIERERER
jgi:hypothetical protein